MSEEKGHISKERWTEMGRDPEQWRDKGAWEERGEQILPIVKKNLDDLRGEFAGVKGELAESRKAFSDFQEFQTTARKADAKKAYQQALKDIQTGQRQAVADMDTDKFDSLEAQKGEIYQDYVADTKEPEQKVDAEPARKVDAEEQKRSEAFIKSNGWFNTDPVMKAYAQAQSFSLMDAKGNINYEQLEKDVKTRFPENFTNPRRDDANLVDGGETKTRSKGSKKFEDLPEAAKAAYAKFKKQIPTFTKEAYLSDYQWD